ncbi:hypothetical protein [Blastococcus aurantiacus]|uniref:hypothetical protein n=1 Tax=Blastococcus aurantiacus TaxID=1550231 RepID=UPI000B0CCFF2|nr:hypothetical protein [Blastococcus aurantiacus]
MEAAVGRHTAVDRHPTLHVRVPGDDDVGALDEHQVISAFCVFRTTNRHTCLVVAHLTTRSLMAGGTLMETGAPDLATPRRVT